MAALLSRELTSLQTSSCTRPSISEKAHFSPCHQQVPARASHTSLAPSSSCSMLSRALRLPRLARPGAGLRYQSTKTFEPNAKLQKWLVDLPSLKLVEEDHTSLSAVQSLVSTVEFEENGAAEKWKKG